MQRPAKAARSALLIYVYAGIVGILGALSALAFQGAVDLLQGFATGREGSILSVARELTWWQRLLLPTLGGLAGALIVIVFVRRSSAYGVADLMEVVSLRQRSIRARPTLARCLSSAATIASGGSVGREGPIIQLGATFASKLTRIAGLGPRREAILLGCGVSAGMAAAYNAPLAGAFFVMEVILANFAIEVFAPVVFSSIVSTVVMHAIRGGDLAIYDIPTNLNFTGILPLGAAILLGIPGGACAVAFQRLMKLIGRGFDRFGSPLAVRVALGGFLVGCIGLVLPEVWGNGYDATSEVLASELPLASVALILLFKPIATALTVGSGASGGVFTPTLLLGAALGSLCGAGLLAALPAMDVHVAAFAVLGMAALIAGTTQAPIMSMLLLFEMTQNRGLLVPLMLVTVTSSLIARLIGKDSIYTERLRARGVPVDAGLEELTLRKTRVRDIMRDASERVQVDTTLDDILRRFQETRRDVVYVIDEGRALLGRISLQDVKPFLNQQDLGPVVIAADVMHDVSSADPDESIAEVIEQFDDPEIEELPVTKMHNQRPVLVGSVARRDLIACLNLEVLKRQSLRAKFVTHDEAESSYVELPKGYSLARVPIPASMAGKTIARSGLREEASLTILTLIVSEDGVEHRLVPDPDLELSENQMLVVLGQTDAIEAFREKTVE